MASYKAVKSVVIANKYVEDIIPGRSLALSPQKHTFPGIDDKPETSGLMLNVCSVKDPGLVDQPNIFAAGKTNVGHMAGLMASTLQREDIVTVGGMGAEAVSSVLKATIIAQKYMLRLGMTDALALVPRYDRFEEESEERVRLLLICVRRVEATAPVADDPECGGG